MAAAAARAPERRRPEPTPAPAIPGPAQGIFVITSPTYAGLRAVRRWCAGSRGGEDRLPRGPRVPDARHAVGIAPLRPSLGSRRWCSTTLIALPPLIVGQATFNEVKIAAFAGGAGTKFMYFGTEMSASVPPHRARDGEHHRPDRALPGVPPGRADLPDPLPEADPGRVRASTVKGSRTTTRRRSRSSATTGWPRRSTSPDFFPKVVANLDPVKGAALVDPRRASGPARASSARRPSPSSGRAAWSGCTAAPARPTRTRSRPR